MSGPDVENDKPTYVEQSTAASDNGDIEVITGVDNNITVVNTIVVTTLVDDLSIVKYDEDYDTDDESEKYNGGSSKGGGLNGPDSNSGDSSTSNYGRYKLPKIINRAYEDSGSNT